jgi:sulfide:quinone oxidoreductase
MAKIVQLEPEIYVASQLVEDDFAEIAARGFRSVVNNRPDREAPDQLLNERAEAATTRHGMLFRFMPVDNLSVTDDAPVKAFAQLMDELPRPTLYYCRSGTRCTILWAQVAVARLGVASTLEIASRAGYDLEVLRDRLTERAQRESAVSSGFIRYPQGQFATAQTRAGG